MPWFGRLVDRRMYAEAFLLAAAAPVAGFLFWLWVNRGAEVEA
jgi:hypothetical protein